MAIENPNHRFRLQMLLWGGNYRGEQPFTSAPQKHFADVLMLVKGIQNSGVHPHVRSYVIQEEVGEGLIPRWSSLDYSDWKDL